MMFEICICLETQGFYFYYFITIVLNYVEAGIL